jgi:hypothetical protein
LSVFEELGEEEGAQMDPLVGEKEEEKAIEEVGDAVEGEEDEVVEENEEYNS